MRVRLESHGPSGRPIQHEDSGLIQTRALFALHGGFTLEVLVSEADGTVKWTAHNRLEGGQIAGGTLVIPPT